MIFLLMFVILGHKIGDVSRENTDVIVDNYKKIIVENIRAAQPVQDGYRNEFTLPKHIYGMPYNISIDNGNQLVIEFNNKIYTEYLPEYVLGGLCTHYSYNDDKYHFVLRKNFNVLSIESCKDCTYSYRMCYNANVIEGGCDLAESIFPGFKDECCEGHCQCCE
ncbi:MAG: hypothetical protein QXK37_04820 [Candidatus Woesearchaeota archaeon]